MSNGQTVGAGSFTGSASIELTTPPADDYGPLETSDYQVLNSGHDTVLVPFLTCEAAQIEGLTASAGRSQTVGGGAELSFSVAGTGVGTSGTVTITSDDTLTCEAGQMKTAYVHVPVFWELRAPIDNDDYSWTHVEVDPGSPNDAEITILENAPSPSAVVLSAARVNNSASGAYEVSQAYSIDGGFSFTVGFSTDLLEASLTVSAEASETISLSASLPGKGAYRVAWLGGPGGARIEAISV